MAESGSIDLSNAEAVSARWVEWRRKLDIGAYDRRFEQMAAAGHDVHGEADFIASYAQSSLLDAGCGTGRIGIELERRGYEVVGVDLDADMVSAARRKQPHMQWFVDDLARMQLPRRFTTIAMPGNVMIFCEPNDRRLIVHNMAQHLEPNGVLIAGFALEPGGYSLQQWDEDCAASGFELSERFSTWDRQPFVGPGDYHVSVHRRANRFTVHDLVAEARSTLERVSPTKLHHELSRDGELVVLDTRQLRDRDTLGYINGSVHAPLSVVEWRVDPASGYTEAGLRGFDQRIVLVCNDGYSSSLAAARLQRLGFGRATDLVGGFQAWVRAGLPLVGVPGAH